MQTVTTDFNDALVNPATKYVRQVWYKRRYWVESSKSYTWETNWTRLPEDQVVSVTPVTSQLDTSTLSEFLTSNLTLVIQDFDNRWKGDNPYGVFKPDSGSPLFGYVPYWTKFQVRAGLIKNDGSTEVVPIFTGLAVDYNSDTTSGSIQINIEGEFALLSGANAENVSTWVTNENIGTGNGSNLDFFTANYGVGLVREVSLNGIRKRAGVDYTISQQNEATLQAKISFYVAPLAGVVVRCTYNYWKQNQKFESLVTALLNEAGVPAGNQQVTPVVFPSNIINSHTYQTQAEWQAGTLTNINTVIVPNAIQLDFASSAARTLTTWADVLTGWNFYATNHCGQLVINTNPPYPWNALAGNAVPGVMSMGYRSQTAATGRWSWRVTAINGGYYLVMPIGNYTFDGVNQTLTPDNDTTRTYGGYCVRITKESAGTTITLRLQRSNTWNTQTTLDSTTMTQDSSFHDIDYVRYPTGYMEVYFDGSLVLSATDTTYTSSTYFHVTAYGTGLVCLTGYMYRPATTLTGSWISTAFDQGATPTAWIPMVTANSPNGGTINFYTASSNDNITYDPFLAVDPSGAINSTLRRYLKTKAELIATLDENDNPTVNNITVGSITASTVITLANFEGQTCYDAIQALGQFANYEFGFDANENFFFRPKSTNSAPLMSLNQSDFAFKIVQQVNGFDRVYSYVRATYADYIFDIVDDGLTPGGPLKQYGYKIIDINGANLLISKDADVATGIAGTFYAYYQKPRRRVKIQTRLIPQIEISDVMSVTFADNTPLGWYLGDTSVYLGNTALSLYGNPEQAVVDMKSKLIGFRIDTDSWMTEFDFEEVLS